MASTSISVPEPGSPPRVINIVPETRGRPYDPHAAKRGNASAQGSLVPSGSQGTQASRGDVTAAVGPRVPALGVSVHARVVGATATVVGSGRAASRGSGVVAGSPGTHARG